MFEEYTYLVWMLIFTIAPIGIIWARYGRRLLWKNRKASRIIAAIAVVYQFIADPFAEAWHAWFFVKDLTMGIWIVNFPIENTIFFALVSIAISSFVIARAGRKRLNQE